VTAEAHGGDDGDDDADEIVVIRSPRAEVWSRPPARRDGRPTAARVSFVDAAGGKDVSRRVYGASASELLLFQGDSKRSTRTADPYYEGKFGIGQNFVSFPPKVLGCVGRRNAARAVCIAMVRNKWFDLAILVLIIVNSWMMALFDPVAEVMNLYSLTNAAILTGEWVFQVLYSFEMLIRLLALGPVGYLKEGWNRLDLIIVATGWMPLIFKALTDNPQPDHLAALEVMRFARILRPLRVIHIFPRLKNLVRAILNAGSQVLEVALLCVSVLFVFALVGMTLFQGNLRQHCAFFNDTAEDWQIPVEEVERYCSLDSKSFGRSCPEGLECRLAGFNPANGLQSFDNFYLSYLTVFQIITLEGWSNLMFALFDTTHKAVGIYFILLLLFGGYFMTNLLVSALSVNYMLVRERAAEKAGLIKKATQAGIDEIVQKQESRASSVVAFVNLPLNDQVELMEMRLMFEYEKHAHDPNYHIVTREMYELYVARNREKYRSWKRKFIRDRVRAERSRRNLVFEDEKQVRTRPLANTDNERGFHDAETALTHAHQGFEHARARLDSVDSTMTGYFSLSSDDDDDENDNGKGSKDKASRGTYTNAESENNGTNQTHSQARRGLLRLASTNTNDTMMTEELFSVSYDSTILDPGEGEATPFTSPLGSQAQAGQCRRWVYKYVTSTRWFMVLTATLIASNTLILALQNAYQPESWKGWQEVANVVFLSIFTVEIFLRMFASGLAHYSTSAFNGLDCFVLLTGYLHFYVGGNSLSFVRALRSLRILRSAHKHNSLRSLLKACHATLLHVTPFLILLTIVIYVLTIAGLHFWGGKLVVEPFIHNYQSVRLGTGEPVNSSLERNPELDCTSSAGSFVRTLMNGTEVVVCPPRTHFDTFLWSMITTFQVVSGDDWNGVMVLLSEHNNTIGTVIYFCGVMLFGWFIVLNFFLAMLIDTFIHLHDDKAGKKGEKTATPSLQRNFSHQDLGIVHESESATLDGDSTTPKPLEIVVPQDDKRPTTTGQLFNHRTGRQGEAPTRLRSYFSSGGDTTASRRRDFKRQSSLLSTGVSTTRTHSRVLERDSSIKGLIERKTRKKYNLTPGEVKETEAFESVSLFCFTRENRFRVAMGVLMRSSVFETVSLLVIIWSCVVLALESPADAYAEAGLRYQNIAIATLFVLEAAIKIIALGFVGHPGAYLCIKWNILDLFIAVSAVVDVIFWGSNVHGMVVLRSLRAIRPLRAVRKFEGMRVIVSSFAKAVVPCLQVGALCVLFYFLFSIAYTLSFSGAMQSCFECPLPGVEGDCVRHYDSGPQCFPVNTWEVTCDPVLECSGLASSTTEWRWLNPSYRSLTFSSGDELETFSFDRFIESSKTLFDVSTLENWMTPMYIATDTVGVGRNLVRGSNDLAALGFILFIFVMHFFLMQIFVAVLINTYLDSTKEETGDAFMTADQREWVQLNKRALSFRFKKHVELLKPKNCVRRFIFDIVTAKYFKVCIYVAIVLNTIALACDHHGKSEDFRFALIVVDSIFGAIYVLEALMKLVAFGPKGYFHSKSNVLDFVIVLVVLLNWILELVPSTGQIEDLRAVQSLRVLRVLRLFNLVASFKTLLRTLIVTAFPILNIIGILMILFFVYATLGVSIFGGLVDVNDDTLEFLGPHVNFNSFVDAFYTLWAMATGESWTSISRELSRFSGIASIYCCSFIILTTLIMLNLFVAVVLAEYSVSFKLHKRQNGIKQHLDEESFRDYNRCWNELHLKHVSELRETVAAVKEELETLSPTAGSQARSQARMKVRRTERDLEEAHRNIHDLPARFFAELLLELKAPLGFKKRSVKSGVSFTASHVLMWIRNHDVPVVRGKINIYTTLSALININIGKVPDDVERLLEHQLGSNKSTRERLSRTRDRDNFEEGSVAEVIAAQKLNYMIWRWIFKWRRKYLQRHGADEETVRQFVREATSRWIRVDD